ncbi:unnamed protein product [Allacma fusca]|uniref:Uncharacterized protein n=1 Tax=Allacma fusca TaxID=39272 RepID=A0A8J2PL22_9HEXA|nr:unnamed protein product [Allacma fusca]
MLSKQELRWGLGVLKLLSHLCLMPFKIDSQNLEIAIEEKSWKRRAFFVLYIITNLHAIFYGVTWFIAIGNPGKYSTRSLPLHTTSVAAYFMLVVWQYELYIRSPHNTITVVNELLFSLGKEHKGGFKWLSYSFQELYIIMLPSNYVAPMSTWILFIMNPDRIYSVYTLLPEAFKNPRIYLICTALDTMLALLSYNTAIFGFFFLLLFFIKIEAALAFGKTNITAKMSYNSATENKISECTKHCRYIQLLVELFNRSFARGIFMHKLLIMSATIVMTYTTIRTYHSSPIEAAASFIIAIVCFVSFPVLFDKAFAIPEKVAELKCLILLEAHKINNKSFWALTKRTLYSVGNVTVNVGDFSVIERASTPNLVNFIVYQIASLIIATKI